MSNDKKLINNELLKIQNEDSVYDKDPELIFHYGVWTLDFSHFYVFLLCLT